MKGTVSLLHLVAFLSTATTHLDLTKDGNGTFGAGSSENETLGELLSRIRDYQRSLVQAAQDVASLHRPARSSSELRPAGGVPKLQVGPDFMRSFTPKSGVGNREEVVVEEMKEMERFSDVTGAVQWTYTRFNNTDCLMGRLERHVIIWKLQVSQYDLLRVGVREAFAVVETEYGSIDTMFYTRTTGYDRELYVAVLSDSRAAPTVHVYEVRHDKLIAVTFMHLEERPVKMAFVESQRGSAIAILLPRQGRTKIVPRQTGHDHQNIVKVYSQYPVDFVTFTVNGMGYIALANTTHCEIFRFDEYLQDFSIFDRVYVPDIVDLEVFHLGFERYLLVVGAFEQQLYVWREGGFFLRQLLASPNVARMHATYVGGCRDDVLLTALGGSRHVPLRLFLWKENEFIPLPDHGLAAIFGSFQVLAGSLESFSENRTVFLLTTDQLSMKNRLFIVRTALRPLPDPVILKGSKVTDIMQEFETNLHAQERDLRFFHEALQHAVTPTNDVIRSHQILHNLNAMQGTSAAIVNRMGPIDWQGSPLTLSDLRWTVNELDREVTDLEKQLDNLEQLLTDVAMRDEDTIMTGHNMIHGPLSAEKMSFMALDLPRVGDTDLRKLMAHVFRLDRPRPIEGRVTFAGDFRIRRNMDVDRVNSIDIAKDVALTTRPQEISGTITFYSPLLVDGDMVVEGTMNGLDLTRDLVTLRSSHYIPAFKNFSFLHAKDSVTSQLVDNVDLPLLAENVLTKSKEHVVHFDLLRVFRDRIGDLVVEGMLNGLALPDLETKLVRIDRPGDIKGLKSIRRPIFDGGIFVGGLVDGLRIPDDFVLNSLEQTIFAPKHFTNVVLQDISVRGTVNGLNLPGDVVTLTSDQEVSPKIFANGIVVDGDLDIKGLVDGVDIRALDNIVQGESRNRPNVVFVGPTVVKGTLKIADYAGIDLLALSKDLVFPDEENIVFTGNKIFSGDSHVPRARVMGSLNGYNLHEDFLNVHGDQIVRGRKTFLSGVEFGRNVITGNNMIGDVDIVELFQNHISLSTPGIINAQLTMADELTIENDLRLKGTVDGVMLPGNVVLRDKNQNIGHKIFLGGLTVQNLGVDGDIWVDNTLDTVDVNTFLRRRVPLSADQTLPGNLVLGDTAASRVQTTLLNDVDLTNFAAKVMSLTRAQIIPHEFAFSGTTSVFGSIITTKGVNDVRVDRVNLNAVKLSGHVVLPSSVTFASPLTVEGDVLVRGGKVNDVDLVQLDMDTVKKTGEFWMSGSNVFASDVQVNGNVEAEFVNGLKLPLVLLLKHGDQTIRGYYHFVDLSVAGNMNNLHLINGHDLSTLQLQLVRNDRPNNVTGSLTVSGPLNIPGHLNTDGLVNGVKVSRLPHDAVHTIGEQKVEGSKKILGRVDVIGDLNVDYINGIDVTAFLNEVVFTTGHQDIPESKTFLNAMDVTSNVRVEGQLQVKGQVDGTDLSHLSQNAVFLHEPAVIAGHKEFADTTVLLGSLLFNGIVNGFNLNDAVLLRSRKLQTLHGVKSFGNVFSSNPVDVFGDVNGHNLPALFEDTLMTGWDQAVTGPKHFKGVVNFLSPVRSANINGMELEKELVFIHGDRELPGNFVFEGMIDVTGDLETSGLINGVDLRRLATDTLYKTGPQTVTGLVQLDNAVFESDVGLKGRLNGVPLARLNKDVHDFELQTLEDEQRLKGRLLENQNVAGYLDSVLQGSLYVLDYFTLQQVLQNFTGKVLDHEAEVYIQAKKSLINFYWGRGSRLVFANAKPIPASSQVFFLDGLPYAIQQDKSGTVLSSVTDERSWTLPPSRTFAYQKFGDKMVIVTAFADLCKVFIFDQQGLLQEIGNIALGNEVVSLSVFVMQKRAYVAVGVTNPTSCMTGMTHLFLWNKETFSRVQTMEGVVQETISFSRFGFDYVVLSLTDNLLRSTIRLMRNCECCSTGLLDTGHSLAVVTFVDMELFEVGSSAELYLAVANKTHVQVQQLAGASGFQPHSLLWATDITSVRSFVFANDLYLVIGQSGRSAGALLYLGVMRGSKVEMLYRRWS